MLPRAAPALPMCTLAMPNPSPKVETTYTGGSGEEDLASPSCPVRSAEGESATEKATVIPAYT
jgi:hypothetical protein